MIRKNGTVKVTQIFIVRAFIAQRTKEGWNQTYYMETVIIANPDHAYQVYMHELNKMKPALFYNSDTKKADCALFVPHIHGDGSLAYWPENGKYIQRFKHNIAMPNASQSAMREIGKAIRAIDSFSFMKLDAVETIENLERLHIARKNLINTLFSCGYELDEFTSCVRKSKHKRALI